VPRGTVPPNPAGASTQASTPKSTSGTLSDKQSPMAEKLSGMKRNASVVSGMSTSPQPVRKRLRRDEVPVFAQSARKMPVRLTKGVGPTMTVKRSAGIGNTVNGHASINGSVPPPAPVFPADPPLEPSITNQTPFEDLTRRVSDWIVRTIGMAEPPSGGAVFEIEAKIGEIHDVEEGQRLSLPVDTETIFNRDNFRRTKFESSMSMVGCRALHPRSNATKMDLLT
jgi:hypothetical protein